MSASLSSVQSGPYRPIAAPVHTVFLIFVEATNAFFGKIHAEEMRHALSLNRPRMYTRTIAVEWLILAIVVVGVRWHGSSLTPVFGDRWRSFQSVLRDLGIATVLLMLSIAVPSILGPHSHAKFSRSRSAISPAPGEI